MARIILKQFITDSVENTQAIAAQLVRSLPKNGVVSFFGDLGSGKTTFIKGMAAALSYKYEVTSPTFTYLNVYEGHPPLYHFDLYRLPSSDEFLNMGFDEYLFAEGICCIEWAERIASLLPPDVIRIEISNLSENIRKIQIYS